MKSKFNNKGQVTIFIILAIVVVAVVFLFFMLRSQGIVPDIGGGKEINPESFLETCLKDKVREGLQMISEQGGSINPELNLKFKFQEEGYYKDISYLCYTESYYKPCINQNPVLINSMEDEIKDYISQDVEFCFDDLTTTLQDQGYVVEVRKKGFNVNLIPVEIRVDIDAEITLTKTDVSSIQDDFSFRIPSRIYELSSLAQEIVSQEARFCNFNYIGYMVFYPEYDIDKLKTSDSTIIYTLEYKGSVEKFRFAVKGCIIPII